MDEKQLARKTYLSNLLYGNERLTADFDDSEAEIFLDWAVARITAIVERNAQQSDEEFDAGWAAYHMALRKAARLLAKTSLDQQEFSELYQSVALLYGETFQKWDSLDWLEHEEAQRGSARGIQAELENIDQFFSGDNQEIDE